MLRSQNKLVTMTGAKIIGIKGEEHSQRSTREHQICKPLVHPLSWVKVDHLIASYASLPFAFTMTKWFKQRLESNNHMAKVQEMHSLEILGYKNRRVRCHIVFSFILVVTCMHKRENTNLSHIRSAIENMMVKNKGQDSMKIWLRI